MASRGKKKTTMAKLNREAKLRERRFDKQARKDARKREADNPATAPADLSDESASAALGERRDDGLVDAGTV
jgi:hypothetical protein